MANPWLPSNHNHKSPRISHNTINYPPHIQNNKPIHYPHKPIVANYPTQIWFKKKKKKKTSASPTTIPLRSENKTHHQTPIYAITETYHQTPILATETHHQTSIQLPTITDPAIEWSCNPSSTNPNSNHSHWPKLWSMPSPWPTT